MSGLLKQSQEQPVAGAPAQAVPAQQQAAPPGGPQQPPQEQVTNEAQEEGDAATPEEQKAYESALGACSKIIHGDDKSHQAVMGMLDEREKIGSLAKASVMLVTQVDAKINMPETILAGVLAQVVDWMLELATVGKKMQFSEKEEEQVLATATDLLLETYGADEDGYNELIQGMDQNKLKGYHEKYEGFLK